MSRLIVKNLPKGISEDKLRSLFSQKGEVTDIQLKFTPDGKFRHFGFIGYRTEQQAVIAKDYFNGICVNTNPIVVEFCAGLGDPNKPKAWSKYAPDSGVHKHENNSVVLLENSKKELKHAKETNKIEEILEKHKNEPLFEEYMQAHLKNDKLWNNDLNLENDKNKPDQQEDASAAELNPEDDIEEEDKLANKNISDLEYMKLLMKNKSTKGRQLMEKKTRPKVKLYIVKVKGLPYSCKKKDLKHFFQPLVPYTIRLPPKLKGFAYVGFKNEMDMNKSLVKDRSFLSGKRISVIKYDQKICEGDNEVEKNIKKKKWSDQEEALKNEESIAESGKIFIRNLAYSTVEDDIQKLFEKFGPLVEVNLPIDKTTRQIKGFGTISFIMPEHAAKAYNELDGTVLNGRMLHLLPAKTKMEDEMDPNSMNYKQKKMLKQKNLSGSSHNWNTLFVGHDAVAETVAETYGTTKATVLGADISQTAKSKGSSAAVRLALGETQIVQNVQKFLEDNDVCLDAFNEAVKKRSKTVLIAKNLPANTTSQEIFKLFEPFGVIGRLVMPPSGITALIEFIEPFEARNAFKKLAYSKFKSLPLYLEWAPENSFKKPIDESKLQNKQFDVETLNNNNYNEEISLKTREDDAVAIHETDTNEVEEEEEPEPNTTLFVKNLNFKTTEQDLKKHFETCGKINYVMIATKKDVNNTGQKLSMGYGFVRYMQQECAEKALKTLNFTTLDGKSLELKRSERTLKNDAVSTKKTSKPSKQTGTKILVRNIPFQANQNEIMELFKTFGEIRALRLPKKMNAGNSHRGFAFVDFHTKNDAKRAFEALSQSTHLYGRRLVLEWAENDTEDLTTLRKRTADLFSQKDNMKKSKKSVFDVELDQD